MAKGLQIPMNPPPPARAGNRVVQASGVDNLTARGQKDSVKD